MSNPQRTVLSLTDQEISMELAERAFRALGAGGRLEIALTGAADVAPLHRAGFCCVEIDAHVVRAVRPSPDCGPDCCTDMNFSETQ